MNCEKYRDMLPLLASGGLEGKQKAELEAHLGSCASCRTTIAEFQEIMDALTGSNGESLTEIEKLRLENRIYHELSGRSAGRGESGLARNLIRVAAGLIIFLFGYGFGMLLSESDERRLATAQLGVTPPVSIDYGRVMASRYRFSSEGLKVIARGKAALPAELTHKP